MTPEPAPIDHAKAAKAANLFISLEASWKSLANCGDPEIESRSSTYLCGVDVSRAYLARSAEIEALSAENARLREALERILETEYPDCSGAEQRDGRDFCRDQMRGRQCDCFAIIAKAALDARGGAA